MASPESNASWVASYLRSLSLEELNDLKRRYQLCEAAASAALAKEKTNG